MPTNRHEILDRWARQAGTGPPPTREAWADDLRRLGAIDRETARALTAGDIPRWPRIPPFEDIQGEELALRAIDRETRAHLRRIASASHDTTGGIVEAPTEAPVPTPPPAATVPESRAPSAVPADRRAPRRAFPPLPPSRSRTSRIGRWTIVLLSAVALVGAVATVLVSRNPPPVEAGRHEPSSPTAPTQSLTPSEARDLRTVEALVAELATALEASDDPSLVAIHDQHLAPLLTLDPAAWRSHPELASAVLALACRRSGATVFGLTREAALVSAVADGWLGGEPKPGSQPPLDALRSLIDWVEAESPS